MEVMFSSPLMIMMFILGMFILLLFVGGIGVAAYQIIRGRFLVDYDRLAAEALQQEQERKQQANKL
jgi:uncharacterized membrane protein (DUF106 family)